MRILFFLHNISKTRHFDGVIQSLAAEGHSIVLAAARQRNRALSLPRSLRLANRDLIARRSAARIEIVPCPVRRLDAWTNAAPALRLARDYLRHADPRYAHKAKLEARSAESAPKAWLAFVHARPWVRRHWRAVSRALAAAEAAIPTDALFNLFIANERPDLVLVTPLVDYGSYQTDYVKSAHRLGIPVAFVPFSWDNLTNRGLIRIQPDRVLVWNAIQEREAMELHGVDQERIVVTGAARFDAFFGMRAATTPQEFCTPLALDPDRPLVLYLCSSEFVAPEEVAFVRRWIQALRQSSDARLRSASILVRPHPAHLKPWKGVSLGARNAAVWTEKETMNADQGLFDSLFHARAVVGLNTSAMIEAGILGKPVHTIVLDEFAGGQEETLHFDYLRAEKGGLLHEARTLEDHVEQLSASLDAGETARERDRRFIERFVRPHGLDVPVTPIVAAEIARVAGIEKRRVRPAPWHMLLRWAMRAGLAWRHFGPRTPADTRRKVTAPVKRRADA
jgi:hypothetical protein